MSARRLKAVSDSTMDDILTVGIDVGGTSIRASVVDVDGQVLEMIQAPPTPPQSARALEDGLDRVVRELVTSTRYRPWGWRSPASSPPIEARFGSLRTCHGWTRRSEVT